MLFEFKVTLDNLLTFAGLLFVAWQMRDANQQRKLETQIKLYDINRELISLGFSLPEMFRVLEDAKGIDSTIERRCLQLWLNQLALIDSFKRSGAFERDVQDSFEADLRGMMSMQNLRRHWKEFGKIYPVSFQKSVAKILHDTGGKLPKKKVPAVRN